MSSLAPGILIAAPPLSDPSFDRSVVLLAAHDPGGSFGWVINGPAVFSVAELLKQSGVQTKLAADSTFLRQEVRRGGPVSTNQVWLLFPESPSSGPVEGHLIVAPGIGATASRSFLERLAQGEKFSGVRAVAGYSGWGAGQLENEVKVGAWLPGAAAAELVFRREMSTLWQDAYALQGTNPMAFTTRTVGSA
jgi:putative transcriptional regulator